MFRSSTAVLAALLLALSIAPSQAREGFAAVNGTKIHYDIEGHGPPVVLLHSAFMSLHQWDNIVPALSRNHTVIRYDERGHGETPFPKRPVYYYVDLRGLLDAFHIRRADIVGSSLGGLIACDFAIAYPSRVRRIVLAGAAPNTDKIDPKESKLYTQMILAARHHGVAAGVAKWVAMPMNASATPAVRERIRTIAMESPDMFILKFWPAKTLEPPAMTMLSQLRAPVLIISGAHDSQSLRADAMRAAKKLPHGHFVTFAHSGHFPNLQEPARFVRVVTRFLDGPKRMARTR